MCDLVFTALGSSTLKQVGHLSINSCTSAAIVGQKYVCINVATVVSVAQCPAVAARCASAMIGVTRFLGTNNFFVRGDFFVGSEAIQEVAIHSHFVANFGNLDVEPFVLFGIHRWSFASCDKFDQGMDDWVFELTLYPVLFA